MTRLTTGKRTHRHTHVADGSVREENGDSPLPRGLRTVIATTCPQRSSDLPGSPSQTSRTHHDWVVTNGCCGDQPDRSAARVVTPGGCCRWARWQAPHARQVVRYSHWSGLRTLRHPPCTCNAAREIKPGYRGGLCAGWASDKARSSDASVTVIPSLVHGQLTSATCAEERGAYTSRFHPARVRDDQWRWTARREKRTRFLDPIS